MSGMRGARSSALIAAAVLGLMAAATGVASASAEAGSKPCGYSESDGHSWYNHCTSDGSLIVIKVDTVAQSDWWLCVGPGVSRLQGSSVNVRNAYYTGDTCSKVGPL